MQSYQSLSRDRETLIKLYSYEEDEHETEQPWRKIKEAQMEDGRFFVFNDVFFT